MAKTLFDEIEHSDAAAATEDKLALEQVSDELNVIDETEDEKLAPTRFRITSYGADLSVFDLRRRLGHEILIPAPFQRKFVWTQRQASRFVESILLGLPVPGIFVYLKDKKQLIVDGQQRLITLDRFLSGTWETKTRKQGGKDVEVVTPFDLVDVDPAWEGRTFQKLDKDDRDEIENYLIHATIFRQDHPKAKDRSIYEVFERINTGGLRLSPQEIRACVSHGTFVVKLGEAAELPNWRRIYGRRSPRLKDEELILRFFALLHAVDSYKRPMRVFLDDYLEANKDISDQSFADLVALFVRTLDVFYDVLGDRAFRPEKAINAAVFDAMMIGCAKRLQNGNVSNKDEFANAYAALLADETFRRNYQRATADEESVKNRIKLATSAFASVT
ncbi:Protein of unknown function DUF262 [Bradyrhizobium sp. Rc3b]|uniref:DUF262 domain-containing protein n=1 Tax=unclassified Bradyrhizobium TaxID=2631580 RepID=UPI0008ED3F16|nr:MULTISPECIES: DUF262 domain-containing protein [unclassified Bradyrhizobium]MBB4377546.1 hypothetical protein [Bradyrhizobium sp. SBR1B]SFM66191.1 Protein of unknown function DUF262 [Bradyrhizobium sp. Rc3b]